VPRLCKATLICARFGCREPLRRSSSVEDEHGRWFCGVACRRKELRNDHKRARRLSRQAAGAGATEIASQNPAKESA
jgi:RNase P protein component